MLHQKQQRRLMARECIKLEEKEIYKQMISQLSSSSNSSRATPAALSSTVSFRTRQDRLNGTMENSRASRTSRDESVDCIIVLDEPCSDPLKKRLDATSSLLSSFVDSDTAASRMRRGRLPLSEANHRSTPATFETSKHMPSILATFEKSRPTSAASGASKPTPASLLEDDSQADMSHVTTDLTRPALGPRSSSHAATSDSRNDIFVDLTSEPTNGCSDSSKAESSVVAVNGGSPGRNWQCGTVRSPVISEWEKSLKQSKYTQDDFVTDLTREKETNERRREMKAKETAVQFYKEKRLESEEQLVSRIRRSLTLSRRLPVPVKEPLYIPDESESDESVVEVEDEEIVDEFPELSDEQEMIVTQALRGGSSDQVLVEGFKLQICRRDIFTLSGLNWLNDEVINFYMNLLMERGGQNNMPKVYCFNTFFYPKLMSGGHQSVRRWTKQVDLFSFDYVLVPVHLGMHWCLAVVDFRRREIRYYDSMGSNNQKCLDALMNYLGRESQEKRQSVMDFDGWQFFAPKDIPQQMNGSDCGMFACKFAEYITRDANISFTQEHMPYFRRRMIYEIVKKQLL